MKQPRIEFISGGLEWTEELEGGAWNSKEEWDKLMPKGFRFPTAQELFALWLDGKRFNFCLSSTDRDDRLVGVGVFYGGGGSNRFGIGAVGIDEVRPARGARPVKKKVA